jgi:hypothetical protein
MISMIGDAVAQQMPRMGIYASGTEKDVLAQRAERAQDTRPVEQSNEGAESKPQGSGDESFHNRTLIDHGKVIVESYDEGGKLVKLTPPGYLPVGKTA